jgi:hypothetical protein
MAEIALILALGAVGYALSRDDFVEGFTSQDHVEEYVDLVQHQDAAGHSNQVPFFRGACNPIYVFRCH